MTNGMTVTLRGQVAELRWGYLQAAELGQWTLSGGTLTATVVTMNEVRMSQPSALTFRVNRQDAAPWIWPVDTLQVANGTVTARLKE